MVGIIAIPVNDLAVQVRILEDLVLKRGRRVSHCNDFCRRIWKSLIAKTFTIMRIRMNAAHRFS